jgi:predicted DNA-binding transcriptional regulator AlpA
MLRSKIDLLIPQIKIPPIAQIAHVEQMTGFHRSTLRRWWEEGKFPRPQKLNGTTLI